MVANRDPQLFNPTDIYAVPAMLGAALTSVLWSLRLFTPLTQVLVALLVFAFRVASLRFKWRVPHATLHRPTDAGHTG